MSVYVCEVCSLPVVSHNAYAQHLRKRKDPRHQELLAVYLRWLETYLMTYRCKKCHVLYQREPHKHKSGPGLCPPCRHLKDTLPSRAYESLKRQKETETFPTWKTLVVQQATWLPNEDLCGEVLRVTQGQEKVSDAMSRLGITFELFRSVGIHILGHGLYMEWASSRKSERCSKVGKLSADRYREMSPDEKAAVLQKRFPRVRSKIEVQMSNDLLSLGERNFQMNQWQSLSVLGRVVPREADIKLTVDGSRKLVIVCDGEAFHGPKCIFGNSEDRIQDDIETAKAYFEAGYSILRYSETEILSQTAKSHVSSVLLRLRSGSSSVMRTWYPPIETWSQ